MSDASRVYCGPACEAVPTPAQIAVRCAEIRRRWTPRDFQVRQYGFDGGPAPYVIPGGFEDGGIGLMLGRGVEMEA